MDLIFGGAYQGKLDYAKKEFHIEEDEIFTCADIDSCAEPEEALLVLQPMKALQILQKRQSRIGDMTEIRAINKLENFTYACAVNGINAVEYLKNNTSFWEDKIVIATDISQGIVPMKPEERAWREMNGRAMAFLAGQAESVTRVFCGLPQKLKQRG